MRTLSSAKIRSKEDPPRSSGAVVPRQLPSKPQVADSVQADRSFARSFFVGLLLVGATGPIGSVIAHRTHALFSLVLIAALQVVALVSFGLYFRRSCRHFLRLKTDLAEQKRLAALSSAASLVAYEMKNSVNGLRAAASVLRAGSDPNLPVRTMLGQIDRLGHLASSLLCFGKPSEPQWVAVALDPLLEQTVEALEVLPEAEEIKVETALQAMSNLECDPLLLATAVDNLVRNAIEAAVTRKDLGGLEQPTVWIRSSVCGDDAVIEVEDNAGGLPPRLLDHLFEPFVTFKSKGIGLGLWMARHAVERQGGTLSFQPTAQGTRFTIRLAKRV